MTDNDTTVTKLDDAIASIPNHIVHPVDELQQVGHRTAARATSSRNNNLFNTVVRGFVSNKNASSPTSRSTSSSTFRSKNTAVTTTKRYPRFASLPSLSSSLRKKSNMLLFVLFISMICVEVVILLRSHKWAIPGSSSLSTSTASFNRNNIENSLSSWKSQSTTITAIDDNRNDEHEAYVSHAIRGCFIRSSSNNSNELYITNGRNSSDCQWELCIHAQISSNGFDGSSNRWYHNRNTMIQYLCTYPASRNKKRNKKKYAIPAEEVQYQFYNPLPDATRYICDRRIAVPPNTNISVSAKECPSHNLHIRSNMFQVSPVEISTATITKTQMQKLMKHQIPIELRFSLPGDVRLFPPLPLFDGCDVPCRSDDLNGVVTNRYVANAPDQRLWTIIFSMEGPKYYNNLNINPMQYRENYFWSTTSYQSEVPLPYYSRAEYKIHHNQFVPYDSGIKGAMFMASNCNSMNNREKIVQDLINYAKFRVDSLGSCLNNAEPPNGMSLGNKVEVMKQYLFYLAFENQCVDDYITEKLWGPFEAGTIPVYYGSPNVKEHVPNNSIIHVDDYNTTEELVEHLIEVSNNRTLYESYHAWRTQPLPEHFRTKYDITDTHSTCRTCRWAYARIYGIGWNHTTQSLRPLHRIGSRQVCLSTSSSSSFSSHKQLLVGHPFVEDWVHTSGNVVSVGPVVLSNEELKNSGASSFAGTPDDDKKCSYPLNNSNYVIDIDHGKFHRYVYNYDGVTDFVIIQNDDELNPLKPQHAVATDAALRLRFAMPVLNDPIIFRQVRDISVWHLQDIGTRYTIMVSSTSTTKELQVQYSDTDKNVVFVDLMTASPSTAAEKIPIMYKIRILVEDIDTFHLKADEVETYFGKIMTEDFLHPMEMYVSAPSLIK